LCSKKYVESILSKLPAEQLHLSTPVHAVSSGKDDMILETTTGEREAFDHIIFACHSDDALRILDTGDEATPEERETLGAFRWSRNEVWLHSDESVGVNSPLKFAVGKWQLTFGLAASLCPARASRGPAGTISRGQP
jgi:predicted NAD/FAD-binding protein